MLSYRLLKKTVRLQKSISIFKNSSAVYIRTTEVHKVSEFYKYLKEQGLQIKKKKRKVDKNTLENVSILYKSLFLAILLFQISCITFKNHS